MKQNSLTKTKATKKTKPTKKNEVTKPKLGEWAAKALTIQENGPRVIRVNLCLGEKVFNGLKSQAEMIDPRGLVGRYITRVLSEADAKEVNLLRIIQPTPRLSFGPL